jgi:hypothetical protein
MSQKDDIVFYEQIAAGLLETAMGATDPRTRDRLIKWANLCIDRLNVSQRFAQSDREKPISVN